MSTQHVNMDEPIHYLPIMPVLPPRITTRWMIRRDFPAILNIEQRSFDYPWSEEDFTRALRDRNTIGIVAEIEITDGLLSSQCLAGYVVYSLNHNHIEILNMAVHDAYRSLGVGRKLCEYVMRKVAYTGAKRSRVFAGIRETNVAAQLFFRSVGFTCTSIEHDVDWEEIDIDESKYWFEYPPRKFRHDTNCTGK